MHILVIPTRSSSQYCLYQHSRFRRSRGFLPSAIIRTARLDDVSALAEAAKTTDWTCVQLKEELERSISTLLVSENEIAKQGFVVGWHVAGELQVMALAVYGQYQRKGIGQALLTELLDISKRKGDTTAVLEVKASNQGALSLYRKLKFEEVGRRSRYYPDGEDALLLQKEL